MLNSKFLALSFKPYKGGLCKLTTPSNHIILNFGVYLGENPLSKIQGLQVDLVDFYCF